MTDTHNRLLNYCLAAGFYKKGEISFPHKQANLLKISRDGWLQPAI